MDIVLRLDDVGRDILHSVQKGMLSSMVQPFLTLCNYPSCLLKIYDYGIWLRPSSNSIAMCFHKGVYIPSSWSLAVLMNNIIYSQHMFHVPPLHVLILLVVVKHNIIIVDASHLGVSLTEQ